MRELHVKVAVRVRPVHGDDQSVVSADSSSKRVTVREPPKKDYLRLDYTRERSYAFDYVFGPTRTTLQVFEESVKPLVEVVLECGVNATVFAYGQTGSGKTHTMLGHGKEAGVMRLALEHLFRISQESSFHVSFVELYNEDIRDLLLTQSNHAPLELREDPHKGVTIAGLTQFLAKDVDQVMDLLQKGNERRVQESTKANSESSRSHAVLQIMTHNGRRLSMIDLAGSERAAETNNKGARLAEGARINRSLLALGNVINALGKKSNKTAYVNFRDSKLTRILKDSLGGKNCRTLMLAHASPTIRSFEETINTLKYANRARAIKNSEDDTITVIRRVEEQQQQHANNTLPISKRTKKKKDPTKHIDHLKHKLKSRPARLGGGAAPASRKHGDDEASRSGKRNCCKIQEPQQQQQQQQRAKGEDEIDAQMQQVGQELERLARLEEASMVEEKTKTDIAVKKLELEVKWRDGVIQKLVDELDRRRSSSRQRRKREDGNDDEWSNQREAKDDDSTTSSKSPTHKRPKDARENESDDDTHQHRRQQQPLFPKISNRRSGGTTIPAPRERRR